MNYKSVVEDIFETLNITEPKIDVYLIAKSLGMSVSEESLDDDISGFLYVKSGKAVIAVNKEDLFKFGTVGERMASIAREAQVHNEKPMVQWFSPSGQGVYSKAFATLSNNTVQITTIKQAEDDQSWIIRLFEPTGQKQKTQLRIKTGKTIRKNITLQPFEIKTLKLDVASSTMVKTNLMEE